MLAFWGERESNKTHPTRVLRKPIALFASSIIQTTLPIQCAGNVEATGATVGAAPVAAATHAVADRDVRTVGDLGVMEGAGGCAPVAVGFVAFAAISRRTLSIPSRHPDHLQG
jgi:hypothetical protein